MTTMKTEGDPLWNIDVRFNNSHTRTYSLNEYVKIVDNMVFEKELAYPFSIDSKDYYIIDECAVAVKEVPGLFCEVGFRGGGGTKFMINGISKTQQRRTCIAIDPYGGLPYEGMDGELTEDHDYNRFLMNFTLKSMYEFTNWHPNVDFIFFQLEDTEFFKRYSDGVPIYADGKKQIVNKYALVHFDGPHTTEAVLNETKWFHKRAERGARFVYDDVEFFYDHPKIENFLFKNGWVRKHKTDFKASYMRL